MFRRLWEFDNKNKADIVFISSMVYNCFHGDKPRPLYSAKEVNEMNTAVLDVHDYGLKFLICVHNHLLLVSGEKIGSSFQFI